MLRNFLDCVPRFFALLALAIALSSCQDTVTGVSSNSITEPPITPPAMNTATSQATSSATALTGPSIIQPKTATSAAIKVRPAVVIAQAVSDSEIVAAGPIVIYKGVSD